ncbi:MAG: hypothetical protein JWN63_2222 [Candidatus Acidoferrum typicum]|nr:hypothetical protein [Candidatus Acidoferrum typicum]
MKNGGYRCFLPTGISEEKEVYGYIKEWVWVQTEDVVPAEIRNRTGDCRGFLRGVPIIWIEDEITRVLNPFWVPVQWKDFLHCVEPGAPMRSLEPSLARALSWAGAVDRARERESASGITISEISRASAEFREYGFTKVSGLLHPGQLSRLRGHFRHLTEDAKGEFVWTGKSQYTWHNEPVMRYFLLQLTSFIGQIAGHPVMPSYSFFTGYTDGAVLPSHTDRAQCEITVSLLTDFVAPPEVKSGWPIAINGASGTSYVTQELGDAIILKGRRLKHWRERLPARHRSHSMLFHYVHEYFTLNLR